MEDPGHSLAGRKLGSAVPSIKGDPAKEGTGAAEPALG